MFAMLYIVLYILDGYLDWYFKDYVTLHYYVIIIVLYIQARVQEFVRNLKAFFFFFFFCLSIFRGGGPAQKIAEKMIFSTEKSSKI